MLTLGQLDSSYRLPTYTQPCAKLAWRAYYPTIRSAQQPQLNAPLPKNKFPLILWLALTLDQLTSAQALANQGAIVLGLWQQPAWPPQQLARQALLSLGCYSQSRQLNSLPLQQHTNMKQIGCCGSGQAGIAVKELQHRSHLMQAALALQTPTINPDTIVTYFQTQFTLPAQ